MTARPRVLYIEPFETGSHAAFTETLTTGIDAEWTRLTMPGRHWKWRMRGSAAYLALEHADLLSRPFDLIWASAYLPLAELVGLCPALAGTPRVLYFHENQFAFPVRREHVGGPDHHFAFTQLVSATAATTVVFNSAYNRDTFLAGARGLLSRMPDAVPADWVDVVASRCEVLAYPVSLSDPPPSPEDDVVDRAAGPTILWNHRWEHDKNPDAFFAALRAVRDRGLPFRLAVCGRRFRTVPAAFTEAEAEFADRIVCYGEADRATYEGLLRTAHVAVSTARHDFFGVAMVEATHGGACPVVPDRLAYPEIFPERYRYPDDDALADVLAGHVQRWLAGEALRADRASIWSPVSASTMLPRYAALITRVLGAS